MKELIPNNTLQFMWLTNFDGETNTLVYVLGTGRRVSVRSRASFTLVSAWTPADIISYIFSDDCVVWGGDDLRLSLNDQSAYGKNPPVVSLDVWSQLLYDVTHCKHKVRRLVLWLPRYCPLVPLLTSITSRWANFIQKQVVIVDLYYGEVKSRELLTWYIRLTKQPGWSVSKLISEERKGGATITNAHDQSVVIALRSTRIKISSPTYHQRILEQAPGLLEKPEWVSHEE